MTSARSESDEKPPPTSLHVLACIPKLRNSNLHMVFGTFYSAVLGCVVVVGHSTLVPSLLSIVVPSRSTLLCTHPNSTTLFPILSKKSVLVLSFEYLTDSYSIVYPKPYPKSERPFWLLWSFRGECINVHKWSIKQLSFHFLKLEGACH